MTHREQFQISCFIKEAEIDFSKMNPWEAKALEETNPWISGLLGAIPVLGVPAEAIHRGVDKGGSPGAGWKRGFGAGWQRGGEVLNRQAWGGGLGLLLSLLAKKPKALGALSGAALFGGVGTGGSQALENKHIQEQRNTMIDLIRAATGGKE